MKEKAENKKTIEINLDAIRSAKDSENDLTVKEVLALPEEERKETLREILKPVFEMLQNQDFQELLRDAEKREEVLTPFIEAILNEPKNRHKYKGITAATVLENLDIMGRVINPEELTAEILKRANQRKRAADAREKQKAKQEQREEPAERIKYNSGNELKITNTKLANEFFSCNPPIAEIEGQLALNTVYSKEQGRDIAVLAYYSFNDKYLKAHGIESREFTDFDYFVAMVCNNLFIENNRKISLTKLWHEMGNPKNPNPRQLEELLKALLKGLSTILHISNRDILEAYNIDTSNYEDIESPVIPVQIKIERSKINGNISNITVNILGLSPFILVAEPLNQITTWNKEVLQLYKGSRTARYWRVMRYLMREIAWMRNDAKRERKITYKNLFDAVGDKRTEDRKATRKLTLELLNTVFIPLNIVSAIKDNEQSGYIKIDLVNNPKLNAKNDKKQRQ